MSPQSDTLNRAILDELTQPGFRLKRLQDWLMTEVWTMDRYRSVGAKPAEYLLEGEALVHDRETLLTLAGESLYEELAGAPPREPKYQNIFGSKSRSSGRSIRRLFYPRAASIGGIGCGFRPADRASKVTDSPPSRARRKRSSLNAWV